MSRYIEENDVIRIVDENRDPVWHANTNYESTLYDISVAPSIDICFCRECKWFDSGKNDSEIWSMCTRHFGKYIDVNADDFCSYGEREDE